MVKGLCSGNLELGMTAPLVSAAQCLQELLQLATLERQRSAAQNQQGQRYGQPPIANVMHGNERQARVILSHPSNKRGRTKQYVLVEVLGRSIHGAEHRRTYSQRPCESSYRRFLRYVVEEEGDCRIKKQ